MDDKKIIFLLSQRDDKDITKVMAFGREKFASAPSSGGVTVAIYGGGGATHSLSKQYGGNVHQL